MATLNARRLGMTSVWRPLFLGIGGCVLDIVLSIWVFPRWMWDTTVADLILYALTLVLIWSLNLQHQVEPHKSRRVAVPSAGWVWPALGGVPLALMVIGVFIVGPLLPLEPREVCERFVAANKLADMQRYSTTNLWPALKAMDAASGGSNFQGRFDLTDEAAGRPEIGGYFVGWRLYDESIAPPVTVTGVFYLVNYSGAWQVEDMFFEVPGEDGGAPQWAKLSLVYSQLFPPPPVKPPVAAPPQTSGRWWRIPPRPPQISGGSAPIKGNPVVIEKGIATVAKEERPLVKGLVAIGAVAVGISAWFKSLFKKKASP